jgi:hypothetical protein
LPALDAHVGLKQHGNSKFPVALVRFGTWYVDTLLASTSVCPPQPSKMKYAGAMPCMKGASLIGDGIVQRQAPQAGRTAVALHRTRVPSWAAR